MQSPPGCGGGRRARRPAGRVRFAPYDARLYLQHAWHERVGHGVSRPHHRGDAARGRGARWHVLARLRHGVAAHDSRELRRAHLPNFRPRRGALVLGLPAQSLAHVCGDVHRRVDILLHQGLRGRNVYDQHGRVRLQDGRWLSRRLRGPPSAEGQALSRGHLPGVPLGARARGILRRAVYHAQRQRLLHRDGHCCGRFVHRAHLAPRDLGNAHVGARELRQRCRAFQAVRPAVRRAVPLLAHRQHAQVRHGGCAFLRQPALLQRALLPGHGHPAHRAAHLQADAREDGRRVGRPREAQALRHDYRRDCGGDRGHHRRDGAHHGLDWHYGHELPLRRGFRAVPRTCIHHARRRWRHCLHRFPLSGGHGVAPAAYGDEALPDHVRVLAVRPDSAGELHGTAGRRHRVSHCDVHPVRASGLGIREGSHGFGRA